MKLLRLVSPLIFLFLAACSPAAAEPPSITQVAEIAVPTETVQATVAPPESILSQMAALEKRGYELVEDEIGWALVTQEGKVVLRTDSESIFIETQDGQTLEYPASSFEVVDTIGVIPLEE